VAEKWAANRIKLIFLPVSGWDRRKVLREASNIVPARFIHSLDIFSAGFV